MVTIRVTLLSWKSWVVLTEDDSYKNIWSCIFLGEHELLCVLLNVFFFLIKKTTLRVPFLIIFYSKKVFWIVSTCYNLCVILKHIFNSHTKNSVVLIPNVIISLWLELSDLSWFSIHFIKLRLKVLGPKWVIFITAPPCPFLSVRPRIHEPY